jgi:mycothiol synthase
MSESRLHENQHQAPQFPELSFRGLQGEADYPHLLTILKESFQADRITETISLEDVATWYAPSDRWDPSRDVLIASVSGAHGESLSVIGFSSLRWYTGLRGIHLYDQNSHLLPEWRGQGYWQVMVRKNEHRLREIAADHPTTFQRFFQAWATDTQGQWISVLEGEGYQAVRRFHNMLHRLEEIPERPIQAGFEVRPVLPGHLRSIWEAQKEVNQDLFENVAENWTEAKYQDWLKDASHTPQYWQIAWDGDQVAGMVLTRIDEEENRTRGRKHGYTEHIFVRRPWQKRGLASALIVRSLQALKAQGMNEAELGVDVENESGAFGLYQRLGYKTFSIDTWFRKPME